jgi:hypothetical protein
MQSAVEIASAFVRNIGRGGVERRFYADDLTAWSPLMGTISLEEYLPKLKAVSEVWARPLDVTIQSRRRTIGSSCRRVQMGSFLTAANMPTPTCSSLNSTRKTAFVTSANISISILSATSYSPQSGTGGRA